MLMNYEPITRVIVMDWVALDWTKVEQELQDCRISYMYHYCHIKVEFTTAMITGSASYA